MVIIDLKYVKPMQEVERVLQAHREFLQSYYDKDLLLASGPKIPREGGVIVALMSRLEAQSFVEADPFYQQGLAEYTIMEFDPVKQHQVLHSLL